MACGCIHVFDIPPISVFLHVFIVCESETAPCSPSPLRHMDLSYSTAGLAKFVDGWGPRGFTKMTSDALHTWNQICPQYGLFDQINLM